MISNIQIVMSSELLNKILTFSSIRKGTSRVWSPTLTMTLIFFGSPKTTERPLSSWLTGGFGICVEDGIVFSKTNSFSVTRSRLKDLSVRFDDLFSSIRCSSDSKLFRFNFLVPDMLLLLLLLLPSSKVLRLLLSLKWKKMVKPSSKCCSRGFDFGGKWCMVWVG